jgi:hypothetical protein
MRKKTQGVRKKNSVEISLMKEHESQAALKRLESPQPSHYSPKPSIR